MCTVDLAHIGLFVLSAVASQGLRERRVSAQDDSSLYSLHRCKGVREKDGDGSLGSEARKVGIAKPMKYDTRGGFKKRNPDETPGPGPAAAMLRDKTFDGDGKRGVSIQGSHDFRYAPSISPGPGAYAPNYDSVLPCLL